MRDQRFVAVHRGGPLDLERHRELALWAAACAEHVLPFFAADRPDDDRPERPWTPPARGRRAPSASARRAPRRSPRTLPHGRRPPSRPAKPPALPATPRRRRTWPITRSVPRGTAFERCARRRAATPRWPSETGNSRACPDGLRPGAVRAGIAEVLQGGVMSEKTVAEKAHVKPGARIAVLHPVAGVVESLGLPADVEFVEPADAQLVFLFVSTCAELEERMPPAVSCRRSHRARRSGSSTARARRPPDST